MPIPLPWSPRFPSWRAIPKRPPTPATSTPPCAATRLFERAGEETFKKQKIRTLFLVAPPHRGCGGAHLWLGPEASHPCHPSSPRPASPMPPRRPIRITGTDHVTEIGRKLGSSDLGNRSPTTKSRMAASSLHFATLRTTSSNPTPPIPSPVGVGRDQTGRGTHRRPSHPPEGEPQGPRTQ